MVSFTAQRARARTSDFYSSNILHIMIILLLSTLKPTHNNHDELLLYILNVASLFFAFITNNISLSSPLRAFARILYVVREATATRVCHWASRPLSFGICAVQAATVIYPHPRPQSLYFIHIVFNSLLFALFALLALSRVRSGEKIMLYCTCVRA